MNADHSFVVQFHNVHAWDIDADMYAFAMRKVYQQTQSGHIDLVDIYPQERIAEDAPSYKNPGWLEWTVRLHTRDGGPSAWFTLGLIQRAIGADFESHS